MPPKRTPIRINAMTLVLAIYCLLLFTRLIDASVLTRDNEYFAVVVLQIMIFLIPGVIFCKLRGSAFTERLRLHLKQELHCCP